MAFETVLYEKKGRVAYITLNRPERLNAFNPKMLQEMSQLWTDYKEDDECWVAVVTGAGRGFCAGGDLKDLSQRFESGEMNDSTGRVSRMQDRFTLSPLINDVWKPVIAAVNGVCAGGGLHFMAECDFAIASDQASFADPHVSSGLVSAVETAGLTRRIPVGAVMRMALMGKYERMSAQRAYELGLVTEVVPHGQLLARATELAETVALNAPYAVRQTKRALLGGLQTTLRDALAIAWDIVEETNRSIDTQEGALAFSQGRKPDWQLR